MKEIVFTRKNKDKWLKYDKLLSEKQYLTPKELTTIYLELTDDLAYANTYYPNSKLTAYINELAGIAHRRIYRTKKTKNNAIVKFYTHDFPLMFYQYRTYFLFSIFIFTLFITIGVFSTSQDIDFARLILGNSYIDMTLKNIDNNDPLAIYKQGNEIDMFLGITINNIKVALYTFLLGILLGLGTLYFLIKNAIMLGSFQYFFYSKKLFWKSIKTIWIHGTIEISVIIIAGTAGFVMASGILTPKTYTRKQAFIQKSRDGLKIMISTIPFFIIAGFLESFVTKYTEMPDILAILIITSSLFLIVYYYYFLPKKLYKQKQFSNLKSIK